MASMRGGPGWSRPRGRPRRALAGFGVLSLAAVVMLVLARLYHGYLSDLLMNLGASLIMVAFGYVIFDPLFEEARKARVEEHLRFDHEAFSARVAASRHSVSILETWTGLLEDAHRAGFTDALRTALRAGVEVRMLLLDPDSAAAAQRTEELRHVSVSTLIRDNLRHLYQFAAELEPAQQRRLTVRVYDASPSIQLYQWDDKALISFFPIGVRAYDAPQIEAYLASPWGDFVQGRFDDLWQHDSTRALAEYMTLAVTVRTGGRDLVDCATGYVVWDEDGYYLDGATMVNELTDHGVSALSVQTHRPLGTHGALGSDFSLTRVDEHHSPGRADLAALFSGKYGPLPGDGDATRRIILRLVPAR